YHLLFSAHDANVLYATFNNHKRGDFKPYLLKSADKGATWTAINTGLPERGSTYCIAEDHEDPNLLFAGTEFGVHYSIDGGANWKPLSGGLPTIAVRDMAIQKRENDLVLATFGRGFQVLDDYSPLRQLKSLAGKETALFPVKDAWMYHERSPLGIRGKGFMGESYYQAENPKVGAVFTWFNRQEFKSAKEQRQSKEREAAKAGKDTPYPSYETLKAEQEEEKPYFVFTVKNSKGETVRKLRADIKKGVQRIVWDFRTPTTSPVNINAASNDNVFMNNDVGHLVAPGTYSVTLSKYEGGKLTEVSGPVNFKVKLLPGNSLPAADPVAAEAWTNRVFELRRAAEGASNMMADAQNKVKHYRDPASSWQVQRALPARASSTKSQ
ncbi:MAG: glycosyl hydrolase, partial [Bacteroidota bacterium]